MILSIIAIGSVSSIAYATSTVISDAGIVTPTLNATNINVSGTCAGCGGSSGTYSTWTNIVNKTASSGNANAIQTINNNGTFFFTSGSDAETVDKTGTVRLISSNPIMGAGFSMPSASSLDNEYNLIMDGTSRSLLIVKGDAEIAHFNICSCLGTLGFVGYTISPNGEYIGLYNNGYVQIWQGS